MSDEELIKSLVDDAMVALRAGDIDAMMANYAEIAGGLAIIFSLIYVGYQIRQGTKVAIAENTRIVMDTYTFHNFVASNPVIAEIFARGLSDFSILSNADQRIFHHTVHPFRLNLSSISETLQGSDRRRRYSRCFLEG